MSTFVVTSKATGEEVYRYEADDAIEWGGFEFDQFDHTELVSPPETIVPAHIVWTASDFLKKFTQAERIACRAARKTDPILDDFFCLLEQSSEVHSDAPETVAGMGYLVHESLLTADRAASILEATE